MSVAHDYVYDFIDAVIVLRDYRTEKWFMLFHTHNISNSQRSVNEIESDIIASCPITNKGRIKPASSIALIIDVLNAHRAHKHQLTPILLSERSRKDIITILYLLLDAF